MSALTEHKAGPSPENEPDGQRTVAPARSWASQFRDAGRGVANAIASERSFLVHIAAAVSVIFAATVFRVTTVEWAILLLCIGAVFSAEAFNSALESLARAVTEEKNPDVGRALDRAAGAVLLVSLASAAAGVAIFLPHLLRLVVD